MKPLGILLKNNKVVNHRSVLKILFNPILRCFGLYIGSIFDKNKYKGIKLGIDKTGFNLNIFRNYYDSFCTCNKYDNILKERILF